MLNWCHINGIMEPGMLRYTRRANLDIVENHLFNSTPHCSLSMSKLPSNVRDGLSVLPKTLML
jgi:hypothetical protein